MAEPSFFRFCSTCKTPIAFEARYYACSVSTCNRKATALYFCSVPCWDAHVPDARHRDAWAEEERAPTREAFVAERAGSAAAGTEAAAVRRVVGVSREVAAPVEASDSVLPTDVLVVVSKLKAYVKARSNLNTSDGVSDVLSEHLRSLCTAAIRSAAQNSRKTVLARDFEAVLKGTVASD